MGEYDFVSRNVETIRERVAAVCARVGRKPEEVELLAVSKFHPIQAVEAAWEAGLRSFGESRVQEAEGKYSADFLAAHRGLRLDLIGHLQSNKAKKASLLFDRIQSLDSIELAKALGTRARAAGRRLEVLLELHTGEESKEGFEDLDALSRGLDAILETGVLVPRGLMTMAPLSADETAVRAAFRRLWSAGEMLRAGAAPKGFDLLSMGMSGDFEIAIEEGSTLVRIGTAIFGERST